MRRRGEKKTEPSPRGEEKTESKRSSVDVSKIYHQNMEVPRLGRNIGREGQWKESLLSVVGGGREE